MNEIFKQGQCVGSGRHELFFSERPEELAAAQAICGGCRVRASCLQWAVDHRAEWGVWGGLIFWDGRPYHRKRGRGRPPRSDQHRPLESSWAELEELVATG